LESGTVLLLGEIHGTVESPAFVAALLCQAAAAGRAVTLALELPDTQNDPLAAYLASAGAPSDRQKLLAQPPWQAQYQDGRTSAAVLSLIDEVRRLRSTGASVEVLLYDPDGHGSARQRERQMAERLERALQAAATDLFVVLTGNLHSRLIRGTRWDPQHRPMGYLLAQWMPERRIISLAISHAGGTVWICTSSKSVDCGGVAVTGGGMGPRNSIQWVGELSETGHHGVYFVGQVSFSPPAWSTSHAEPSFSQDPVTEQPLEPSATQLLRW
jgi:hypothetical protein